MLWVVGVGTVGLTDQYSVLSFLTCPIKMINPKDLLIYLGPTLGHFSDLDDTSHCAI
jgi:hypothetical protein